VRRLRQWLIRLTTSMTRRHDDTRLCEEIGDHVAFETETNLRRGLSPAEARRRALLTFGSRETFKENYRDQQGVPALEHAVQDCHHALRLLRRSPGLSSTIVLTLALAFGANQVIFHAVDTMFWRPLPYRDGDRLVVLAKGAVASSDARQLVSIPEIEEWRRANHTFEDLAFLTPPGNAFLQVAAETATPAEEIAIAWVSANFTNVLGMAPMIGPGFQPGQASVLLGHDFWRRRFAGSPSAIGALVRIAGTSFQIAGVMPSTMTVPAPNVDVYGLAEALPQWRDIRAGRGPGYALGLGRLRESGRLDHLVSRAQEDLRGLAIQPARAPDDPTSAVFASSLREYSYANHERAAMLLWVGVGSVLLIGCLNVTGLLLARNASRRQELATRRALGAQSGRLARQLLTETLTLAFVAAVVSIPLSLWGASALSTLLTGVSEEAALDAWLQTVMSSAVLTVAAGLAVGVVPTVHLLRRASTGQTVRVHRPLSDRQTSLSASLVAQLALTVALLVTTGVLLRSYMAVEHLDPGFRRAGVLTLFAGSGDLGLEFYPRAIERLRVLPGVEFVGASNTLMFVPPGGSSTLKQVDGQPSEPPDRWRPLWSLRVGGDYFQALGIALLEGRLFADTDGPQAPPVAIVNETMAHRFWSGESPVGKRFRDGTPQGPDDDWITVVGVVRDARNFALEQAPVAQWYQPQRQSGRATTVMFVRTNVSPESIVPTARAALHDLDKSVRIARIGTLDQQVARQTEPRRRQATILMAFSAFALVLGAIGIFGLMRYTVRRRTNEIGLRLALGATRWLIAKLMLSRAMWLVGVGVTTGMVIALVVTRAVAHLLFGVSAMDPVAFTVAPATLLALAMVATLLPLRRAMRIEPATTLRAD